MSEFTKTDDYLINSNDGYFIPLHIAYTLFSVNEYVYELPSLYIYFDGMALCNWESDKLLRCDTSNIPGPELETSEVALNAISIVKGESLKDFWQAAKHNDHPFYVQEFNKFKIFSGTVNGLDWTDRIEPYIPPYDKIHPKEKGLLIKNEVYFCTKYKVLTLNDIYVKESDIIDFSKKHGITLNHYEKPIIKQAVNSENDLGDDDIQKFIQEIAADYPKATSKDIVSHCFECYRRNNRKLSTVKEVIRGLGIKMDKKGGRRSNNLIKYMQTARTYRPRQ